MIPVLQPRILVACIGNIFLGDDGFGVEVARRMRGRSVPAGVTIKDFGIRGFDLAYALMDAYDFVILVDACPRGGEPGSLYLIEPEPLDAGDSPVAVEGHTMNPMNVLRMVRSMGGEPPRMRILGCEPADFGPPDEGKLGLSPAVENAIDEAIRMIESSISELRAGLLIQKPQSAAPQSRESSI